MSILITGNKGYIGSGLSGDGIDIKDGIDILNYKAKKKYDVVIHTAALTSVVDSEKNKMKYWKTNVYGTENIIKQHPEAHFIYLSTAGVYGEGNNHTVQSEVKPSSIYGWTKYFGEEAVKEYCNSWVIFRLTNVIGGGERGEPNVYQIFSNQDELTIYGDGLQTRDFVSIEFVRKVIMSGINMSGIYNVGSGVSKTILDVAKEFNKPIKFMPERKGEIRNFGLKKYAINNITQS